MRKGEEFSPKLEGGPRWSCFGDALVAVMEVERREKGVHVSLPSQTHMHVREGKRREKGRREGGRRRYLPVRRGRGMQWRWWPVVGGGGASGFKTP